VHAEAPATDEYVPVAHAVQADTPAALYFPAGHAVHTVDVVAATVAE
jgi:hypothetical protein